MDGPQSRVVLCILVRRINGEMQPLPNSELVLDYHRWMGGVDIHDQLRMQRYSVQLSYKSRKYYRTLFLGLFDMALVNAFIVFRYHKKVNNLRPAKHFAFFEELMEQLIAVDSPQALTAIEVHAGSLAVLWWCRKYLCNVVREGRDTCFCIWHIEWKIGNEIPPMLLDGHKTRKRPPASRPGKKRRCRAEESRGGDGDGVDDNDGCGGDSGDGSDGGDADTNPNDDGDRVAGGDNYGIVLFTCS
ncbi:unnamed protein product [Phytophthora fragariaefolia]|uniref:Unnamed protein product n=1 Tax=Phytophthora fragariaefolia TaxID=1490495 RepID=A0A9W6UA90_9STRA|nr:unnamed protein product [Phytophthora fragariaefolia]